MGARPAERRPPLRVEDLILSVLCTAAGPLLWWFGTGALASASAGGGIQLVERSVASLCAGTGAVIALWWFVAVLGAGLTAAGHRWHSAPLSRIGRRLSPAFLRRVATSVLGANVLLTPGAWAADAIPLGLPPQGSEAAPTVAVAAVQEVVPHAGWLPVPGASPAAYTPAPEVPSGPHGTSGFLTSVLVEPAGEHGLPTPTWTPETPAPAGPGATRTARPPAVEASTVTVRRGDCLWDIASHELGPAATDLEIDRRWRQWHEHNRETVGPEADLLQPGWVLTAPPFD
ncbi:LysM peptidoglycan-binding domain-containing protein [Citricoccus nitrophenolicus]|uniref:LysM peptidoglycan-binding domain-containing protein n=1 Tax=Citricoccus nitrophenolicus TaxID=863575 RepID=UPI0031E6ADEA